MVLSMDALGVLDSVCTAHLQHTYRSEAASVEGEEDAAYNLDRQGGSRAADLLSRILISTARGLIALELANHRLHNNQPTASR